ncbi:MAG: SIS domain-containing protein [Desulfarculus sp.]|nr:MAG: SIS domain-containing protein [Desulfarculus sp.]
MLTMAAASLKRSIEVKQEFLRQGLGEAVRAAEVISQALLAGGKLLAMGNGGSAADAQHLAAEFVNRYVMERPGLPALALTTDSSILTSIANDYEYGEVFARQIKALGREGDVALGLSTSGRSPNVLAGLAAARQRGMHTIGLCGGYCEAMAPLCEVLISAPSQETPRVQEVHGFIVHLLCELVDHKLFGSAP